MVAEVKAAERVFTRGDVNAEGLIYWGKTEGWMTPVRFNERRAKHLANCRRTYERTKEDNKRLAREWYANNREHAKARFKSWRQDNPDKVYQYSRQRLTLMQANRPPDYNQSMVNAIHAWKDRVAQCLGIKFTVDHIVPLSLGGEHSHRNMTPIPYHWNAKKHRDNAEKVPGCWKREPQ